MLRLTWTQMRAAAGRLSAAAIAIVLGTAFVTTVLLASATMEETSHRAFTASYANADVVLTNPEELTAADLAAVRAASEVSAADPISSLGVAASADGRTEWGLVGATPADRRLSVSQPATGQYPAGPDEVVLEAGLADRLGVGMGDQIELDAQAPAGGDGPGAGTTHAVDIVGLLPEPTNFFMQSSQIVVHPGVHAQIAAEAESPGISEIMAVLTGDATAAGLSTTLAEELGPQTQVRTVAELAEERTAQTAGGDAVFTALLLGFAAVALAVAALVIANTFTVLIAQRTRTLALLRCVGADRAQIRRSVLLEAGILGLLASLVGLGLGVGITAAGLQVLQGADLDLPLDTGVHLSPGIVATVLVIGLAVTLVTAGVPARLATKVAPLAALRPVEGTPAAGVGRVRAILAWLAAGGGLVLLVGGVLLARSAGSDDSATLLGALGLGVLGGMLSLFGLLLGSVFIVPRLIALAGRLLARAVPGRIATANAIRNPRRTATTTSALVIGVTLVTMMSTGATAARHTLESSLDERYAVDLALDAGPAAEGGLSDRQQHAVEGHPDVAATALMSASMVDLDAAGSQTSIDVVATDGGDLAGVIRDADLVAALSDETIVLGPQTAMQLGVDDGDPISVTGAAGAQADLSAVVHRIGRTAALVTPGTLASLDPAPVTASLWAQLADDANELSVVNDIQNDLTQAAPAGQAAAAVNGMAVERAGYQQVVDTLLTIVIGLLGVAVLIALVGVANTLSLSVLERRRESAMLRAVGLTRGQLRGMLAVEGVFIAGAGALIGAVAGLAYGWAGSAVILSGMGPVPLAVPWRDLGLVVLIALIAGLAASVLPARSAVRTPPVAALAAD